MSWEEAFTNRKNQGNISESPKQIKEEVNLEHECLESLPVQNNNDRKKTDEILSIFQKIKTNLNEIWDNIIVETSYKPSSVLICGATKTENTTLIASFLSIFLALDLNMTTLFIDTNADFSSNDSIIVPKKFQSEYASKYCEKDLFSDIFPTEYEGLFILSMTQRMIKEFVNQKTQDNKKSDNNFIRSFKNHFDVIIINSQPIIFSPSMIEIAKVSDSTAIICKYGFSRREPVKLTIDKLKKNNIKISGVIMYDRIFPVPAWVYRFLSS